MAKDAKLLHGTTAWFEMVGLQMREAAERSGLPTDLNVSLVERYTDGRDLGGDLVFGIRFDMSGGVPSFRVGVREQERGDITITISSAAARALNHMRSDDPAYTTARDQFRSSGEMRVDGDLSQLGDWLGAVHDVIVDRTA